MKRNTLLSLGLLLVITMGFNACSDHAVFEKASTRNTIVVMDCNTTTTVTPTQYTQMLSEDVLAKLVTPTIFHTYHAVNGIKTVCIEMGSAQLIRK